jgi:hypothetical protein
MQPFVGDPGSYIPGGQLCEGHPGFFCSEGVLVLEELKRVSL